MTPGTARSGVGSLLRRLSPNVGAIVSTTSDDLALTFDDGPDPYETQRLLELLDRHGATATFFVLLTRTRRHPSVLAEVIAAGHEIGLHGPDHQALSDFSFRVATHRTIEARDELEQATGSPVRWFRPPYGSQSLTSYLASRRAGLTPVLWSATTWDWKAVPQQERIKKALAGAGPGTIMLAHDGTADASDRADTVEDSACDRAGLMAELLEKLGDRGLAVRSLGEVLTTAKAMRTPRLTTRPPQPG
ncbi:MAG: polysaccharide deacetylase family protein [Microthrixaceae bacterium]